MKIIDRIMSRLASHTTRDFTPEERANAVAAEITAAGGQALAAPADITRQEEVAAMVAQAAQHFGGPVTLIAKMAQSPIQTVFIETNSPFLSKGWPLLRKPDMPLTYRVRLGRRFEVDGDVKQFVGVLEGYFRDELSASRRGRPTVH